MAVPSDSARSTSEILLIIKDHARTRYADLRATSWLEVYSCAVHTSRDEERVMTMIARDTGLSSHRRFRRSTRSWSAPNAVRAVAACVRVWSCIRLRVQGHLWSKYQARGGSRTWGVRHCRWNAPAAGATRESPRSTWCRTLASISCHLQFSTRARHPYRCQSTRDERLVTHAHTWDTFARCSEREPTWRPSRWLVPAWCHRRFLFALPNRLRHARRVEA